MSTSPHAHILSDLHLIHPNEPFYQAVLRFIREVPKPGDHLILAGDIFDVYVGNKAVFRDRHRPFFEAVRNAGAQGVTIHHIEGNHDFWLAESYSEMGCAPVFVHGDFVHVDLEGRKLRVEHGDMADSTDRFYLVLRRFFRSSLGLGLIRVLPGGLLDRVGQLWSNGSRNAKTLPDDWSEDDRARLRSVFFNYARSQLGPGKADALVMGHCHDPHSCEGYMNVGFPRRHQHWIRWNAKTNELERIPFEFK